MSTNATPIDWDEVKNYFLVCRSIKLTAFHFGIKANTISKRCARYGWGQEETPPNGDISPSKGQIREDKKGQTEDRKGQAEDKKGQTEDKKGQTEDRKGQAEDKKGQAEDRKGQAEDRKGQAEDKKGQAEDRKGQAEDRKEDTSCPIPACFPQLPYIRNLTSDEAGYIYPWLAPVIDRCKLLTKDAYRAYIQNPATSDFLISGIIGVSPNRRINVNNPPARMVAIVADYDTVLPPEMRIKMLKKLATPPNFISSSYSGGTRAVWILESPLPIPGDKAAQDKLLSLICKDLKLKTAFGPLDENAFFQYSQVYHAGWNWQLVTDEPIRDERSLLWLSDAIKKARSTTADIPLDAVAAEVERRFPGRWQGEFTAGARGVRFWDAQADNQTAAIVTPSGMLCFTGPRSFMSWEAIFGTAFLERYKQETFGRPLKECFVVNHLFYVLGEKDGLPRWQTFNRQNFESLLTHRYGLQSQSLQHGQPSEVKQAVAAIIDLNTYAAARPFIYNPNTIVYYAGEHTLNTSLLRVHQPDEGKGKSWGDGFPWIAAFLESLFPDLIQRDRFISEWAYAYRHAHAGKPKNGRVTFIAGDVGVGKNFLTECLIGPSLGGYTDPSSYLLGHTRFNDTFFSVGAWVCNDTVAKGDERERQIFTASLKRLAANMEHVWEGKFKGACKIEWSGRVYITLNTDPVSLQILPDLDQSNRDKISLYRVSGPPLNDPQAPAKAKAELGALCAYLLNMEFPEHCRDGARWGVKNYLHPDLKAEAVSSSSTASFGEILRLYCKDRFEADPALERIEGPSMEFLRLMLEHSSLKEMLRGSETPRSFGKRLATLANTESFPLRYVRTNTERLWRVERDEFIAYLKSGGGEADIDDEMPF